MKMDISGIDSSLANYQTSLGNSLGLDTTSSSSKSGKSFSDYMSDALSSLNDSMSTMNTSTNNLISGKTDDLSQVMVNMTEAQLNLETAVQVRDKIVSAYDDIKDMQF